MLKSKKKLDEIAHKQPLLAQMFICQYLMLMAAPLCQEK